MSIVKLVVHPHTAVSLVALKALNQDKQARQAMIVKTETA